VPTHVKYISTTQHNERYMDDIVQGNWNLKPVNSIVRYTPVVGLSQTFCWTYPGMKIKRWDRGFLMEQIRKGIVLRHVEMNDRSGAVIERGHKLKKGAKEKRLKMLEEIRDFSRRGESKLNKVPICSRTDQKGMEKNVNSFNNQKMEIEAGSS